MPRSPVRGPAPAEPVRALSVRALSVRVPGVLAGVARERQPAAPGRPEQPATLSFPAVREGRDRQPDRRGTWVILSIAGLIALALLGWGLNSYLDNQAQETAMVTVPSVTGEPRATAQAKITRAGLTPEVTTENSKTVPADHVISQDPEGAVRVAKGRTVKLVVSAGPEAVTIPDLVGKTEAEARQVLGDLGLTVGEVTPENDTKKPKGQVVSSSPASGDAVAPGTAVALKLSSGQVTVPDLVGKTQNEAFTLLTEAGLTPKSAYKQTADAAEGTVLEQDKKAGDVVDAASVVLITIAQGEPSDAHPLGERDAHPVSVGHTHPGVAVTVGEPQLGGLTGVVSG